MSDTTTSKLNILWTNDDPVTAELMVLMYATNGMIHEFWDEITIIVWGATANLVKDNPKIQDLIKQAQQAGVHISACKACADQLGATSALEDLGIEVIYWGQPLTKILKDNEKLLSI